MYNFCESTRNSQINGTEPYCSAKPYCQIATGWYLCDVAEVYSDASRAVMHSAAARGRLHCRFSRGNSCKHTAACNTLRVRGQCWRVIANQRAAACTILTVVVSARFILYEEQIGAMPRRGVEFNEDRPSDFAKYEQVNEPRYWSDGRKKKMNLIYRVRKWILFSANSLYETWIPSIAFKWILT